MNREEQLLLTLCRAYLDGEGVAPVDGVDWGALFRLARHHNLLAVCHCSVNRNKAAFPPAFVRALQEAFYDCVYLSEKQGLALAELDEAMTAAGIPYLLFKGAVLRDCYPVKESRSMGDIDLLIRAQDKPVVKAILTESGYACTAENGPVNDYRRDTVLLEVHERLLTEFGDGAFADAFDNAVFDGMRGTLTPTYHTAYLIAHTAHHFKFYGAGIRHILDLAVMQRHFDVDHDAVLALLEPIGLATFGRVLLSICAKWFGTGKSYPVETEKCEAFLVRAGVFGSLGDASAVLTRRELEQGRSGKALSARLHLAFPNYETLRRLPYLPFLDGRPWLVPGAWAYRFYFHMTHRKDFTKAAVQELGSREALAQAEEQLAFFKEIGL